MGQLRKFGISLFVDLRPILYLVVRPRTPPRTFLQCFALDSHCTKAKHFRNVLGRVLGQKTRYKTPPLKLRNYTRKSIYLNLFDCTFPKLKQSCFETEFSKLLRKIQKYPIAMNPQHVTRFVNFNWPWGISGYFDKLVPLNTSLHLFTF